MPPIVCSITECSLQQMGEFCVGVLMSVSLRGW